jgi:adenylate kinase
MIYVLLGMQGSGKGTQAKRLSNYLGIEHINLGQYFRNEIAKKTPIGIIAYQYISQGNLVPDNIVCAVVESMFIKKYSGFVFDGFPRTIPQARYLNERHPVDKVIYLELDDSRAIRRMKARRICNSCRKDYNLLINPPKVEGVCDSCQDTVTARQDDTNELIQNRLDLFHTETKPLTDFYKNLGLLTVIDADDDINDIHKKILGHV